MLHNIKYFYKYVTFETALLILKNRTLKYSSPILFNDPFDTQTRFDFDFEPSELIEVFRDELYRLIHDDKEPIGDNRVPLFRDMQAAKKVVYVKKPPVITKLNDYIQYLTGQNIQKFRYDKMFYDLFLSKSDHWKYEQEWRVFIPPIDIENPIIKKDENGNELLYYLMPLYPQEIHSIYFGCKMTDAKRLNIESLLINDFAHVKKYKCRQNEREYKLDFEEMIG